MAVCNIFSPISNPTGTFLIFSKYIEDLSEYRINKSNSNISPSSFYALNVDCDVINTKLNDLYNNENKKDPDNINNIIPGLFQNKFENIWAYLKDNYYNIGGDDWNDFSELFWSFMYDNNFLTINKENNITNIVYKGQISLESYNDHNNMGYGELFCHIPPLDSVKSYIYNGDINFINGRSIEQINTTHLIGFDENTSSTIPLKSRLNSDGSLKEQDKYPPKNHINLSNDSLTCENKMSETKFDINMIVVCYEKNGKEIPMGVYFPGIFKATEISAISPISTFALSPDVISPGGDIELEYIYCDHITNTKTIYIGNNDIFGGSTTYGLRICTRFTAQPNSMVNIGEIDNIDDKNIYSEFSVLFAKMSDTIDKMNEIIQSANTTNVNVSNIYSVLKNNKTNVPYIKEINGVKYWFVNGRKLYGMDVFKDLTPEEIKSDYNKVFDEDE